MARKLRKAVGSKGSGRRSRLVLLGVALIAAMAVAIPGALAVHDTGAFQLDGNAETSVQSPIPANDDWDRVCREVLGMDCSTTDTTTGATAVAWTEDSLLDGTPSLNASIFTGGGSKDPIDIDQWAWKDGAGGLPDKANLLHSFAARYSLPDSETCPSGDAATCEVLFFGSDRYDNSGDAVQGFWFFQNAITLGDPATQKLGGGTAFNGVHKNGDLLVISEFSNGGSKSTIFVYKWNSAVDGNLELLASSDAANCAVVGPNDQFCGIVNAQDGTVAPWPFLDKSGNNTYLQGEFFEAGINLSTLGLADLCFASVASETRTSTSTTSVLKDFVLGSFAPCETELTTTPKTGDGSAIPAEGVTVGSSVRDSAVLDVTGTATWQGTLSFFLCGPDDLDVDGLCSAGGTQIGSTMIIDNTTVQPILSDAATVTETGTHCWRGFFDSGTEGVPDATDASAGECFEVIQLQPNMNTAQEFVPNDSATITVVSGGGDLAGSVVFELFVNDATCAGAAAYTSGAIDITTGVGNGLSQTVMSANATAYTSSATFHWVVTYTSTNSAHKDVTSACGIETSSIMIDNGVTQPAD